MNFLKLLPVIFSFLLLAAHFMRAGQDVLLILMLVLPLLLLLKKPWVPRVIQVVLFLGAIEWVRTLATFAQVRVAMGEPWTRMAIILGAVALFTALSGLVFKNRALYERYRGGVSAV
jgi:hypothetical protein